MCWLYASHFLVRSIRGKVFVKVTTYSQLVSEGPVMGEYWLFNLCWLCYKFCVSHSSDGLFLPVFSLLQMLNKLH
jgi:hypothetical protein